MRDVQSKIINADLKCGRCPSAWIVTDLLAARITVPCPVCGDSNDINEAVKRGRD